MKEWAVGAIAVGDPLTICINNLDDWIALDRINNEIHETKLCTAWWNEMKKRIFFALLL